ncbi:tumor necrosis factor receptor superfamily member EDAR, partial [Lates japonicus]
MAGLSRSLQRVDRPRRKSVYLGHVNLFPTQGGENFSLSPPSIKEEPADTPTCTRAEAETQLEQLITDHTGGLIARLLIPQCIGETGPVCRPPPDPPSLSSRKKDAKMSERRGQKKSIFLSSLL